MLMYVNTIIGIELRPFGVLVNLTTGSSKFSKINDKGSKEKNSLGRSISSCPHHRDSFVLSHCHRPTHMVSRYFFGFNMMSLLVTREGCVGSCYTNVPVKNFPSLQTAFSTMKYNLFRNRHRLKTGIQPPSSSVEENSVHGPPDQLIGSIEQK